jgi:hypothetical protein
VLHFFSCSRKRRRYLLTHEKFMNWVLLPFYALVSAALEFDGGDHLRDAHFVLSFGVESLGVWCEFNRLARSRHASLSSTR